MEWQLAWKVVRRRGNLDFSIVGERIYCPRLVYTYGPFFACATLNEAIRFAKGGLPDHYWVWEIAGVPFEPQPNYFPLPLLGENHYPTIQRWTELLYEEGAEAADEFLYHTNLWLPRPPKWLVLASFALLRPVYEIRQDGSVQVVDYPVEKPVIRYRLTHPARTIELDVSYIYEIQNAEVSAYAKE